ncbi:MAG: hypothetical protein ACJ77M_14995 [Thermoleophilaceae bacterium]
MIEPRIYRAAFVPALFAFMLAMFSLGGRPAPLPQSGAADILFDGRSAAVQLQSIVQQAPSRKPGSAGDVSVAGAVVHRFRQEGFVTTVQRWTEDGKPLRNVIGRRAGVSPKTIVVLAGRDSSRAPDATGSAADTAALLELGRVFQGRAATKTLELVSADGRSMGDAGVRHYVETLRDRTDVIAVIAISNLAAPRSRGPLVIGWSNDATRGSIGLERTAAASLRFELGQVPAQPAFPEQLLRLAFPIGVGAQGVLLDNGISALRISGSGETDPPARDTSVSDVDVNRYGELGRGVIRLVAALDDAPKAPAHGPRSYLTIAGQAMPGWAVSLFTLTLILPALFAAVDAFARVRRRRQPVGRWLWWLVAGTVPFVIGLALDEILSLTGVGLDAPPAPLDPAQAKLDSGAIVTLALVAATIALSWILLRSRVIRRAGTLPRPAAPGAACVVSLVFVGASLWMWFLNPYMALLAMPALHCWMIATQTELRPRTAWILAGVGLLPGLVLGLFYLVRLGLDPLHGVWYLSLLVTGGAVGLSTALLGCVLLGITASVAAIVRARSREFEPPAAAVTDEAPSVFGPGGHAGPGMLGGTESAIRR